jgi:uncharacterized protein (TIGR02246 family)
MISRPHPVRDRRTAVARSLAAAALGAGLLATAACGLFQGGGGDGTPSAADLASIADLRHAYLEAHNDGDADSLAALFTDDAVYEPADDPTCEGHDQIADYFDDLLHDAPATAEFDVRETKVIGDWAFMRINVTLTETDPETGEEMQTQERHLWVLRRQKDGGWKIARLITNVVEPDDEGGDEDADPGRRA